MFKNKLMYVLIILVFVLSIGMVCASDNSTADVSLTDDDSQDINELEIPDSIDDEAISEDVDASADTESDIEDISFEVNSSDINSAESDSVVNVVPKKDSLNFLESKYHVAKIKTKDFSTYYKSDIFFKAKVLNGITNAPMKGVKVLFRVYSMNHKYKDYYAITNKNGVATLNKNLNVGKYTVYTYVKEKNVIFEKSKSTLRVKATAEMGCCSFYLQVGSNDGVIGFRRDSTYAADIYIKASKWYGRTALRQYKYNGGYFFHAITTSDGWMIGTGGADNPSVNKAIEDLAGKMVSSGKISKSSLNAIQSYIGSLGIGHFAIKAPNGKYAAVWIGSMKTGKLKNGEFISVPNSAYCFRSGKYTDYDSNPSKAAVYIGATDSYGLNRRDITVFHWKVKTKNYKNTAYVVVCAANDDGELRGMSTAYLKDNIYYKNTFISKNSLPYSPNMKLLGTHKFGNIDKLIKTPTTVKASSVVAKFNTTKSFSIVVKHKITKKPIKNIRIKVKSTYNKTTKSYIFKTNSKGIAKFPLKKFRVGTHRLEIVHANNKYMISAKSKIVIKRII